MIAYGSATENERFHGAIIMCLTQGNEKIMYQKRVVQSHRTGATLEACERQLKNAIIRENDSKAKIVELKQQTTEWRAKLSEIQKAKMVLEKRQRGGEVIENYDKYIEALDKAIQSRQVPYDKILHLAESANVTHSTNVRTVEMLTIRVVEEKKKIEDDVRFLEECDVLVTVISKYIDIISKSEPSSMHVKQREKLLSQFSTETSGTSVSKFVRFG